MVRVAIVVEVDLPDAVVRDENAAVLDATIRRLLDMQLGATHRLEVHPDPDAVFSTDS